MVNKKFSRAMNKRKLGRIAVTAVMMSAEVGRNPVAASADTAQITEGTKFYCNINALNATERADHQQLTDKLIRVRTEIVESEKGYEFQFSPLTVSLGELANWVEAEGKCCPFFDFHIDLEQEGRRLCLRLTGVKGIKPFIRAEFKVPEVKQP